MDERMNECGGPTARKRNVFADCVEVEKAQNRLTQMIQFDSTSSKAVLAEAVRISETGCF